MSCQTSSEQAGSGENQISAGQAGKPAKEAASALARAWGFAGAEALSRPMCTPR